jgi:hypothetical protein
MSDNPWQYATYEGAEKLQHEQAKKLTLSERLDVLDGMLAFACSMKPSDAPVVAENLPKYGTDSE